MVQSKTSIRVRYAETDMMGIVYHSRYLPWLECSRIQLLDDLGCPYVEMEKMGVRLPVVEVNCRYRYPARFDDRVTVTAEIREMPRARIKIYYQVQRDDGQLLCEASTLHGFMDLENRPCRPPEKLRKAFQASFPSS
ncbi:acyl-CoA thioesterase [Puniceicoccus vermicola]|uniref:Acyl-CoA thioesterase n=1 Tax=Puniceicoccus vermicola TaxID=388746 RepID=A0A7X1AYH3_9BACT|nr:thioesterase family protein [Puniceicoccus vermicola]MBC2602335.1 acyl-CoA thioesterase [Puniceicoccus vermicola]